MALPAGLTPITATTGPWTLPDGSVATGRATITFSAPDVVHLPSGQPIGTGDMQQHLVNGQASWTLCPTDALGLNRTGWTYTLRVQLAGAQVQPSPKTFLLPANGPTTVDLDALTAVPSSTGTPISFPAMIAPAGGVDGQVLGIVGGKLAWVTVATYPTTSGF